MECQNDNREEFSSKFGFIISCIGAALGLGNIWMFSYKLGAYGGAAFLIPYFIFVFLLGTSGLVTEFSFGRIHRNGSFAGIKKTFSKKGLKGGSIIGAIPPIGLVGVLMFYCIVIGWVFKYFSLSITGEINTIETTSYFSNFSGTASSIPWFFLALLITVLVVCLGITKGIERLNKLIMPILFVIFIILTVKSLSLPGSMKGVDYLLTPDFHYLLKAETWIMALGQAFFTVSLNGCGMVVYGSYINEKINIPSSAFSTAIFDTIAALLASFMIMPAVFAFGLDPAAGPSLLFITVPKIFQEMSYGGLLSFIFFLSIIFATISSSVNMLEGPVEAILSATKLSRVKASILVGVVAFILALPLTTSMDRFGSFTDFVTIIISPIGSLIVAICLFFFTSKETVLNDINRNVKHKVGDWFIVYGKYIFTIVTILVVILGVVYGGIG